MAVKPKKFSFGPGFLVAAAFIGPGTVTTCSLAGANFGYSLLFALLFATITTLVLQEMTGRLSLGSGRDLGQALRELPQTRAARLIYVILTLAAISLGCAAYEAGNIIGGSLGLEMITNVPQKLWVVLISLLAILVLSKKKYALVEKVLIGLVFLMSISFLATFILIKPDLPALFKGFVPSFPPGSLMLVLALVGTTVVPYNLFLHSSTVKEKWKGRENLSAVRKDLLVSIGLGGLISIAIVVTSAAAFFSSGIPVAKGVQLSEQLKPLFGPFANILFGIGFFAAGMSSAITAPFAAAYASSGILGWKGQKKARGFQGVWLAVILIGLLVSLFDFNPLSVIVFAQVANGIILPVASIFLLIALNDKSQMGQLTNTWLQNILGGVIILIVTGLGIWNIFKLFL